MEFNNKHKVILCIALLFIIGWVVGSGGVTFFHAKGLSYLSDSPEACKNCHSMNDVYDKWAKGGHHHVATCNDCHTPHNFIGKWSTKALNGFNHSLAFTLEKKLPIVFEAKPSSKKIVHDNCIRCHETVASHASGTTLNQESLDCISCHKNPAH